MDYIEQFNDGASIASKQSKNLFLNQSIKYQFVEKYRVKGSKRPKSRSLWGSGESGTNIRDAKTGFITHFIVGNPADEANFFKVCDSRGKFGPDPVFLYYDSPESYETHFGLQLNSDIKKKWMDKKNKLVPPRM